MSWTDERVDLLSRLWMEGRSASQIANELGLGVTRNAVIGKVHRLGLAGRPKLALQGATPQSRVKPKLAQRPSVEENVEPVAEAELPADGAADADLSGAGRAGPAGCRDSLSERVTIMDLRESSCRWPMGDPMNPEFRYCGARAAAGSGPYCNAHSRLAFQPAPERRRDRVERYARIA